MPFTFSHPAIVLPLRWLPKNWFSMTGLIVGSMTPDFEYFMRMKILSDYSHTVDGVFWFDVPLGLLVAFLFHLVIRDRLIDNLPYAVKTRVYVVKQFNWTGYFKSNWIVVLISLIIGIFSHLLWDSLTHEGGFFVDANPALQTPYNIFGVDIFLYRILQHISSVLGLVVIFATIYRLPVDVSTPRGIDIRYWIAIVAVTVFITVIRTAIDPGKFPPTQLIVTFIASGIIGLSLAPLVLRKFPRASR